MNFTAIQCLTASVILLVVMSAYGCTSVPQKEYAAYVQAFDETKKASEQLILDLDEAEKIAAKIESGRNPPAAQVSPFPSHVSLEKFGSPSIDPVDARRKALEVVSRFNTVLVDLAAGKKPEQIKSSVDSLVDGLNGVAGLLGETLPVPGIANGLITTVIDQLQQAQNRKQFVTAMNEAAPIIDAILNLFLRDAQDTYEIMARVAKKNSKREKDTVFDLLLQMQAVTAERKSPQAKSMAAELSNVEKRLRIILDQVGLKKEQGYSSDLKTKGATAFDAITLSQLQQTLAQAEAAALKYTAIINKQKAYHQLAISYGQLLWKTRQSLKVVREALDRPADIHAQATELTGFAFRVKRDLEDLKTAQHDAAGN